MGTEREAILESLLRYFRFPQGFKYIKKRDNIVLVDLGCGPKYPFYSFVRRRGVDVCQYVGVDPLVETGFFDKRTREAVRS